MKSEYRQQDIDDASTLSRLLGPPGGDRSEASPCARKMGIHDAFIHVQVRVFSRHRLIYEFKRGAIHEGFFGKASRHLAGRKFERFLKIITGVMHEQLLRALRKIFGWYLEPRRPRQEPLIFILPEELNAPEPNPSEPDQSDPKASPAQALTQAVQDYVI